MKINVEQNKISFSLKAKILLAIISLMLSFLVLELGLRFAGFLLVANMDEIEMDAPYKNPEDSVRILCLGDSYTFGGEGERDETYPAFMQRQIDKLQTKEPIAVINRGMCEFNSSQVLQSITGWLDEFDPHVVVLLVGATNRFNPWDNRLDLEKSMTARIKSKILSLRVSKLLRIIYWNLKGRAIGADNVLATAIKSDDLNSFLGEVGGERRWDRSIRYVENFLRSKDLDKHDPVQSLWYYYQNNQIEKAIRISEKLEDDNPLLCQISSNLAIIHYKSGHAEKAQTTFDNIAETCSNTEIYKNMLIYFYGELMEQAEDSRNFSKVVGHAIQILKIDPTEHNAYFTMAQAFEFQSRYDSKYVVKEFKQMLAANEALALNIQFLSYLEMFENKTIWEEHIKKWQREDIQKIVEICNKRRIKLVLQTYPVVYSMANDVIKDIAAKYSLPLVKNQKVFKKLEPLDEYILDDDHCTAKGHEIMAKNVIKVLLEQKVITQ